MLVAFVSIEYIGFIEIVAALLLAIEVLAPPPPQPTKRDTTDAINNFFMTISIRKVLLRLDLQKKYYPKCR